MATERNDVKALKREQRNTSIAAMSDSDWSSSYSYDSEDRDALDEADELVVRKGGGDGATFPQHPHTQQVDGKANLEDPAASCSPLVHRRRGRRVSHLVSVTATGDAIAAYAEVLRTTTSQRASVSTGASSAEQSLLPEETRRRHRDSKRRMEVAEKTQQALLKAHELHAVVEDMPLWVHARVIPPRWRQQIVEHVTPIHAQMGFCEQHLLRAWKLLHPPFDKVNFLEYEARFKLFENSIALLEAALADCQKKATEGEKMGACVFIQLWYRKQLAQVS